MNYGDAIYQFRTDRDPKTRLFRFKAGVLVSFAMDLEQVYMTTKLDKDATYFLPFNQGTGHGITAGAGNPLYEDKYSVSYMWEDILQKDTRACKLCLLLCGFQFAQLIVHYHGKRIAAKI